MSSLGAENLSVSHSKKRDSQITFPDRLMDTHADKSSSVRQELEEDCSQTSAKSNDLSHAIFTCNDSSEGSHKCLKCTGLLKCRQYRNQNNMCKINIHEPCNDK